MIAPWITTDDLVDQDFVTAHPELAQDAVAAASFVLFALSGRKYGGVRTVTEEYCQVGLDHFGLSTYYGPTGHPPLPGPGGYAIIYPELQYGIITNQIGGWCNTCGCTHLLRLRGAPVLSVKAVSVGSNDLDPSDYGLYDYSFIASPHACWRTCDDMTVTYTYGAPPPALGRMAAKAMADQFVLALEGSEECTLPERVTQISRQGMAITLLDPQDFLDKGRTGVYAADLFITTVNPDGARLRPRVFSPDIPRGRSVRRTTPTIP
jgi:hypothetical protein